MINDVDLKKIGSKRKKNCIILDFDSMILL